jgi:ankyrin repeat protein
MRTGIVFLCFASILRGGDASSPQIRDAATRALTLLQASQKTWYSKIGCHSCHHQFLPALAFQAAREHDVPVDEAIARADAVKAFAYADLDAAVQFRDVVETTMDLAYALVAANATGLRANLALQVYARAIAGRQDPEGNWDDIHQRPPQSYSRFTQTALGLRAIELYSHPNQKAEVAARVARARMWLLSHTPRDTEERTWQLTGLSWAGSTPAERAPMARALAALQRSDGGWNSLEGRESDAYSTAEVLVALHDAGGISVSDRAWRRGIDYLVRTQMPDGSWHVASRLHPPAQVSPAYFESGYPYAHDQYLSATAASLAVIALSEALGPGRGAATPPWAQDLQGVEPWAETILFGSVTDLKRLLDGGFDPNSATKAGGTTALMMAAPDPEKMKLLLDRGADVNARAKSKYSALMVAAIYRDGTPGMKLLLSRGADVSGTPSPLVLAAGIGNAEALKPLHEAGASLSRALLAAVRTGQLGAARELLDLGAPLDETDASDASALDRAVVSNQLELTRLLIERGANVNRVGRSGMTPLLYAASIDFGDSKMIELLLTSGAQPDAVTKDGLTALELARKYRHTHLLASLEGSR